MPPPAPPLRLLRSLPSSAARALSRATLWAQGGDGAAAAAAASAPEHFDVIVIGAGVMGSAIAHELAARGHGRVACLEQHDFLHRRGSSHGETRIIRRTYSQAHYTEGMARSYALWERAQQEYGSAVFTRCGGLDWAIQGNPALAQLVASSVQHGVPHERLTPEQVAQRFPGLRLPAGYEAVYQADAGVLNATKAVAMFQELARRKGALLLDRCRVLSLTPEAAGGVRVGTSRGTMHASKVVLAAGAWAAQLLAQLGVDVRGVLNAVPVAASYWRCKDAASAAQLAVERCPVVIGYTGAGVHHAHHDLLPPGAECYVCPQMELPGLVKVSLHLPEHLWGAPLADPDVRSLAPPADVVRKHVTPFVQLHLPGVDSTGPVLVEPCMYTMTPDHEFVVDQLLGGRVWVASCCSGHGFKFAPLIGAALADLVNTGATDQLGAALDTFSIARLLRPKL